MKTFECKNCYNDFESIGYDNPVFLADTVADCPKCNIKCWEKTYKISKSEYERLIENGVNIKLFS